MTLGEKIKEVRKEYGYSQEQFAEKLSVSRSAVAKWEAGNGMPDVDNLKAISVLLNVSVDYLLYECDAKDRNVIREEYDLALYSKGTKAKKKNRVIKERFPNADIYHLLGVQKLTKREKVLDNLLGVFTDIPFGTPSLVNSVKNLDKEFYLVEENSKQYFVMVTDEYIEIRQPSAPITENDFEFEGFKFKKCKYKVK